MTPLLWIAVGTLASEDLACAAAGALVAQGRIGFIKGTLACLAGIVSGDLLLFLAGRLGGRAALRWGPIAHMLPPDKVNAASAWLHARGPAVVLISRFTPGLRLPVFFAAGLLKQPLPAFAAYFLLAASLWTPLLVGAAALLGEQTLRRVLTGGTPAAAALFVAAAAGLRWMMKAWVR
jgi:membrane protein DedA with SNARE-associated domain